MHPKYDEFLDLVRREPALWRAIDIRIVALRVDGGWQNVYTYLYLRGEEPEHCPVIRHAVANDLLLARQDTLPIQRLDETLRAIAGGLLTVGGHTIAYRPIGPVDQSTEPDFSDLVDIYPSWGYRDYGARWQGYMLRTRGALGSSPLNRLPNNGRESVERALRAGRPAFAEIGKLLAQVTGTAQPQLEANNVIECLAFVELRVATDSSWFEGEDLIFEVEAGSRLVASHCEVEVDFPNAGPAVPSVGWRPKPGEWRESGEGLLRCRGNIAVGARTSVDLNLYCGKVFLGATRVESQGIAGPWPLLRAYGIADPELKALASGLKTPVPSGGKMRKSSGRPQAEFAEAVARVLAVSGWHVDLIAAAEASDSADIHAYSAARQLMLAVECTLGDPDNKEKHRKLARRVLDLREATGLDSVHGLLATSLLGGQVPDSVRRGIADYGLWLCAQEQLLEMLRLARTGTTPSQTLEYLSLVNQA